MNPPRVAPTKKRKRNSANVLPHKTSKYDIERDVMLWKTEVERQRNIVRPLLRDGDLLFSGMPPQPPCSDNCTFERIVDADQPNMFICHRHFRIHECGECCRRKIQSRENWTCPWTKNVLEISLIAEDRTSSSNCGRHQSGDTYSKRGYGDEASEKSLKRLKRVSDAMEEATRVSMPALEAEGIPAEDYQKQLHDYFALISYHTDMFGKNRVLTKKAVVQFGLACSYMQRNGFATTERGRTKLFFEKKATFERHLPKTHALIQAGYKVRAVTRTQDLLRRYLSQALIKAPDLDLSFPKK